MAPADNDRTIPVRGSRYRDNDVPARGGVEGKVRDAIANSSIFRMVEDRTSDRHPDRFEKPDFRIATNDAEIELELKTKGSIYKTAPKFWPSDVPENDLMQLDDLCLRKLMEHGKHAYLLVGQFVGQSRESWHLWNVYDLMRAEKRFMGDRELRYSSTSQAKKGKLSLRFSSNADRSDTIDEALHTSLAFMVHCVEKAWHMNPEWQWTAALNNALKRKPGGNAGELILPEHLRDAWRVGRAGP